MDISAGGQIGKEGSMRYEEIKQLIDLFEETDLAEMELTRENDGLRLVRGNGGKAASQQVLPVQPEIPEAPSLSGHCCVRTEWGKRGNGRRFCTGC